MQTRNVPRTSVCQTINYYFGKFFAGLIGFGSGVPSVQYAATFPYDTTTQQVMPSEVSFNWLATLSPPVMTGIIYNGACTFVASGAFGYRFLQVAYAKINDEILLLREGKNVKRFATETTMALFSAIASASISGGPFVGALKWVASLVGFTTGFSLSFLGMCELIITLADQDHAFRLKIINNLKRLSPEYRAQVELLLHGKELTADTLHIFLREVAQLAQQNKLQYSANNSTTPFFRKKTKIENYKVLGRADYVISTTLTGMCSFMYLQTSYNGTNAMSYDKLTDFGMPAKIIMSIPAALAPTLFSFFTLKLFEGPFLKACSTIEYDTIQILKVLGLSLLSLGNATWYYGLGKLLAQSENIFSSTLDSDFGQTVFPWALYATCLIMGVNGLAPMVFPVQVNTQQPRLNDVIKSLELNQFPSINLSELKQHTFFRKQANIPVQIEIQDLKTEMKTKTNPG